MGKNKLIVFVLICVLFLSSCATFITKEEELQIKQYEKAEYILLEDTGEGERFIRKGEKVKLYIIVENDFIKVFCYFSKVDFVKAQRTLILYLFEEDFDKAKFNIDLFKEKLFSKVATTNR